MSANREDITTKDRYQLLEAIGQGSMSTVYKALDTRSNRPVAIKVFDLQTVSDPDFQSRLLEALYAIEALDHPNIVPIYEVTLHDGKLFVVMDYIDGITLRQRLNERLAWGRVLDLREIVSLTRQVAQALHYAHEHGVLHRDVKPDNVLIRRTGEPVAVNLQAMLTDFGFGALPGGSEVQPTLGTLAYMAPEQLRGNPVDGRYDVYSLGVMLYELVTGRLPFISDSPSDLILMHTQGEPERVQDLRPDVPPALVSIIHRAMLKNPKERYPNAAIIARQLEALEKSIKPAAQGSDFTWSVRRPVSNPNGPATTYDVLPSLDRPVIPVDLFSEGSDDIIIITPYRGASRTVSLNKASFTVGRDPECDIRLDDGIVSRRHLRIECLPDSELTVTDLDSLNGVYLNDVRLGKNAVTTWSDTQSVKVGPFWLTLRLSRTPVGLGRRAVTAPHTIETLLTDSKALIRLTPSEAVAEPGGDVILRVELIDQSETEQQYIIAIEGLPPDWYTIAHIPMHVPPHGRSERMISLHPPRMSSSTARTYHYTLSVTNKDRLLGNLGGALRIVPYFDFTCDIVTRERGTHLLITNRGNTQSFYITEIRDRQNILLIMPTRTRTLILPGETAELDLKIQPKKRPITGEARRYPVEVLIRTDGINPQTLSFNYWVRPWVAWWVPIILLIMAVSFIVYVLTNLHR